MKINLFTGVFTLLLVLSSSAQISHKTWDGLLQKHVSKSGKVNYKGMIQDKKQLQSYLDLLSSNRPKNSWSDDERLAFWINAYNAFTVKLIVDNYPVKSIKDLGGSIYRINTPWDIKFFEIGGEKMHLNNIEHNIIRKEFDEPRIHFAVVCAAKSCPKLRNEAYTASKLDAQLDDQAKYFLRNGYKNKIDPNHPKLSKLFKWYGRDFPSGDDFIDFLNKYTAVKINKDAKIDWMDYNWSLNE